MTDDSPGASSFLLGATAVQPQVDCTLVISRMASPVLVKANSWVTSSFGLSSPKLWTGCANTILGVPVAVAGDSLWPRAPDPSASRTTSPGMMARNRFMWPPYLIPDVNVVESVERNTLSIFSRRFN